VFHVGVVFRGQTPRQVLGDFGTRLWITGSILGNVQIHVSRRGSIGIFGGTGQQLTVHGLSPFRLLCFLGSSTFNVDVESVCNHSTKSTLGQQQQEDLVDGNKRQQQRDNKDDFSHSGAPSCSTTFLNNKHFWRPFISTRFTRLIGVLQASASS
jgi:hypothetical protein